MSTLTLLNSAINRYINCKDVEKASMLTVNQFITVDKKISASNVKDLIHSLGNYATNARNSVEKQIAKSVLQRLNDYAYIVCD